MSVAPSFQKLELVGEPFAEGDKEYIFVRYPDGHTRKARWYEEEPKRIRSIKDVLGFEKGYITIFKGDIEPLQEWFMTEPVCRYHVAWGWYVISTDELPQLPAGVTAVRLPWETVSQPDGTLKPPSAITAAVEELIYDENASQHLGTVGERKDFTLTIQKAIPIEDYFGKKILHIMSDSDGNIATWTTAAKALAVGETYRVRGTIKDLVVYKGQKQTTLTRCTIL